MGLDHMNKAWKGRPIHITTRTKPQPYLLGDPLLILPSVHPLLGSVHLSIIPSQPTSHFNLMLHHNLSGMHRSKSGGLNTTMLHLYCLHHLPNHSSYTLLHPSNPRCLPNQIRTQTIGRLSKYTMERHHIQLVLWKSRRLTSDLGEFSQITNLHLLLARLRKKERKEILK